MIPWKKWGTKKCLFPLKKFYCGPAAAHITQLYSECPRGQMGGVTLSHLLILSHAKKRTSAKLKSAKNGDIVFQNILISIWGILMID